MKKMGFYQLTDSDIIALEEFECKIAREKYQTIRKQLLFNTIESFLKKENLVYLEVIDKRSKLNGLKLIFLGEIRRIDYCKFSFIQKAYFDIDSHQIKIIDLGIHH